MQALERENATESRRNIKTILLKTSSVQQDVEEMQLLQAERRASGLAQSPRNDPFRQLTVGRRGNAGNSHLLVFT